MSRFRYSSIQRKSLLPAVDAWWWHLSQLCHLLFFVLASFGCGILESPPEKPDEEDLGPSSIIKNQAPLGVESQLQCDKGTSLSYDNFGEAFMLNYCSSCHSQQLTSADERRGAPAQVNLDTPDGVIQWRTKIILVATSSERSMPPSLHVPAAERALLTEWLQCGAPAGLDNITN